MRDPQQRQGAAVSIERYEFRTQGSRTFQQRSSQPLMEYRSATSSRTRLAPTGLRTCVDTAALRLLSPAREKNAMLWTIFVILLVMWLLGLVTSYTMGGFIHILLVVAIAVLLIQVITGRRAV